MKRNPLAPFLEAAADRYHAEGYVHKYAQAALGCAASFGEWLRTRQVPLERISEEHVDGFLQWFVPGPPGKYSHKRKLTLAATRSILALIRARYPMMPPSPVQAEVGRYVEHLRRNRGLAEATLELHQRYLEQFLTSCFKQGNVDYSAITAARIHAYVDGFLLLQSTIWAEAEQTKQWAFSESFPPSRSSSSRCRIAGLGGPPVSSH